MSNKQQCMSCKQNPATVKLTKLVKGTVEETWLCQECAAQQSPYQKKMAALSLDAILAGILGQQKHEAAVKPGNVELACKTCGLPYESYRSTLLLGCSDCYESFEKYLVSDLRKFHGSTMHRGRNPQQGTEPGAPAVVQPQRNANDLRKRLREAVEAEDFELAAKLRDELRSLEGAPGQS
jgi:protein arginine kinase activator